MKTLFACGLYLGLGLALTPAAALAGEGPLPAGKPAGVHSAALNSPTEIAVGVAVAAAIALILASTSSKSSPVTAA